MKKKKKNFTRDTVGIQTIGTFSCDRQCIKVLTFSSTALAPIKNHIFDYINYSSWTEADILGLDSNSAVERW
jgi:hypothetical protein